MDYAPVVISTARRVTDGTQAQGQYAMELQCDVMGPPHCAGMRQLLNTIYRQQTLVCMR